MNRIACLCTSLLFLTIIVLPPRAAAQEKLPEPTAPSTPAPAKPPAKKAPKEAPKPSVDPANLPAPYPGIAIRDPRGIDALKVLENNEPEAALALLDQALKGSATDNASAKEELRLTKAMIQIRTGKVADARTSLRSLMLVEPPETGVRDDPPVARRAKALEAVCNVQPKGGQIKPDAWREALKQGAVKTRDELRKVLNGLKQDQDRREWSSIERNIRLARTHLEALDTLRDAADPAVWDEVAQQHAERVESIIQAMNARAAADISDFVLLRGRMFQSTLDPARNWLPLRDATQWARNREELIEMKRIGGQLTDHYRKAKSKWGTREVFAHAPGIAISDFDIPPPRPGSTFSR